MIIQKKEFKWRSPLKPLNLKKITAVALHHMAHPTAGMDEIHQWHLARDNGTWKGFAYNFWIDFAGNVFECRGFNEGAGVKDKNSTILSVGFQGDYNKSSMMPSAQFIAGCELIHYLRKKVPSITQIDGHKRWQATSCPGKYFPLEVMVKMANTIEKIKDYDETADWAKEAVLRARAEGIMLGDDNGYFHPKDPVTRQEMAVIISRLLKR
jgi:hypothetical protein